MHTVHIGQHGELAAATYLEQLGYRIVERNWRRRECEIDIVAYKDRIMHFVEVKYRMSNAAGSGLEYITSAKLKRMAYAARRWVSAKDWRGEYVLSAIEVEGNNFMVTAFVECIDT